MEIFNVISKAIFLGISSSGIPLSIVVYLIYQILQKNRNINKDLFLSIFISFLFICILIISGKNIAINYFKPQIIINIFNCGINLLIAFNIAIYIIKKKKLINLFSKKDCDEYQDIYQVINEDEGNFQKNNIINFYNLFIGILLMITNWKWILWSNISAKALMFQVFKRFNIELIGLFAVTVFIICFLLSIFLLLTIISKLLSILTIFINDYMLNFIFIILALFFAISAVKLIVINFNLINLI